MTDEPINQAEQQKRAEVYYVDEDGKTQVRKARTDGEFIYPEDAVASDAVESQFWTHADAEKAFREGRIL